MIKVQCAPGYKIRNPQNNFARLADDGLGVAEEKELAVGHGVALPGPHHAPT